MADPGALEIPCPTEGLHGAMTRIHSETESERGPRIEIYKCAECSRKVAVVFEPAAAMSADQKNWVQQEIARHGAFFPSDFRNGPGVRRW